MSVGPQRSDSAGTHCRSPKVRGHGRTTPCVRSGDSSLRPDAATLVRPLQGGASRGCATLKGPERSDSSPKINSVCTPNFKLESRKVPEKIGSPQLIGPVSSKGAADAFVLFLLHYGRRTGRGGPAVGRSKNDRRKSLSRIISGKHCEGSQTQTAWFCQYLSQPGNSAGCRPPLGWIDP